MLFAIIGILLLSGSASATCSGSGLAWSCTAGSTSGQLQTAINNASDNAVITLANGSYAISGIDLFSRNGVTIICATVGGCTITTAGDIFVNNACVADKTNLIRISGFNFTGAGSSGKIWLYCSGTFKLTQVHIDHNDFANIGTGQIAILFGESGTNSRVFGLVDHNNCHGTNNFMCMKNISGGTSAWLTGQAGSAGASQAMYFEDNICNFTNVADTGTGCIDVWRSNSTVARFNNLFKSRIVNHSYCHEGPYNSEVYGNIINDPDAALLNYRNIHFQGSGEEIAFGNTVEINAGGDTIVVQHFRGDPSTASGAGAEGNCNSLSDGTRTGTGADSSHANDGNRSPVGTYGGYPSWHQPGRDGAGVMKPVYSFMNKSAGGTRVDLVINSCTGGPPCYTPKELQQNRDFYNGISTTPWTTPATPLTTGVAFGTLANRPTSCTATSEPLDAGHGGVGYWATDQGSWNTSGNGFGNGILYTCTNTNTWTVAYTPYLYPHPLQGASPAPVVQLSPTSLTFGPQAVGTQSANQTVTLTNIGNATLNIASIVTTGDFVEISDTCTSTLAIGTSCAYTVAFFPTASGARSGFTSIVDNAAGSPHSVPLSGTGQPTSATLTPNPLAFGQHAVGSSIPLTATLTNTGAGVLTLNCGGCGFGLAGSAFAFTSTNCGTQLGPSQSCTMIITFNPSSIGNVTGTLTATNDASSSPQVINLSGTGGTAHWQLGRASASGVARWGVNAGLPTTGAALPVLWVDQHMCDPPGGVYTEADVTLGTQTIPALLAAVNQWAGGWRRIKVPAGWNLHGSSYPADNSLISMPIVANPTGCLVIESTTPNTAGTMVCSHGLPLPGQGSRNVGCTNDIAKMWKLTADSSTAAGNNNINFPFLSNHIVVRDVELAPAAGSAASKTGVKANVVAELNGDHIGLERSYIHGYDPGDAGQPTGATAATDSNGVCLGWSKTSLVDTSGTTVTRHISVPDSLSGETYGMEVSDGTHSAGYPQATVIINGVAHTVTNHDPTASNLTFTINTSAGTQTGVTMTWTNPATRFGHGCGDDNRGVQINCDYCYLAYNYFEKIHWIGSESHAISSGFSHGPVKVVHNWVESGAAGYFSGGGPANIRGGPTSNFEIRGNIFMRDLNWRFLSGGASQSPAPPFGCGPLDNNAAHDTCPLSWGVKNNIEFKTGTKALIDGNILDGVWADGQSGYLMLMTVKQDAGGYDPVSGLPLGRMEDFRISNNWFRNGPQMIQLITRSLGHGNGNGVSNPLQRFDFLNNVATNIGDNQQWGSPGTDIAQWPASNQTYLATLSRTSGVAHAVAQAMRITNYASGSDNGFSNNALDFSSMSSVADVVTIDLGEQFDPKIGGTITIANKPGWNGTFAITGVKFGSVTTPCTTGIHGATVSDPTFATQPQPCIVTTGINAGSFGDTIIYTDNINHPGTATLCTSAPTCKTSVSGIQASFDTHWFRITDISVGDGVYVHDCTGGTNPSTFEVGSTLLVPALPPTNPSGLDVYYANVDVTHDPDNSGTMCLLENGNGLPKNMSFSHNTVLTQKIMSIQAQPGPNSESYNNSIIHNIFGMPAGNNAVLSCVSVGGQGTSVFSCWDSATFKYFDNIMQGRTSSQWSVVPGGSTVNAFPATVECSGATADATCLGYAGYMNGVTFPTSVCSYDGSNPANCPIMALPWSSNFDLAKITPVASSLYKLQGVDLTTLQNAFTSTKYVCPAGANCGLGPTLD